MRHDFLCNFTEWDPKDEDQTDVNVWEDNWDDDVVEDDFSVQLR
jgi:26 proteasome complex subunit DSS1